MIIRPVRSVVGITAINFAATSTAEETLSHATKGLLLCMIEVHSFFLHHKKISFKLLTNLRDDLVGYALLIIDVELQLFDAIGYVFQFLSYQLKLFSVLAKGVVIVGNTINLFAENSFYLRWKNVQLFVEAVAFTVLLFVDEGKNLLLKAIILGSKTLYEGTV